MSDEKVIIYASAAISHGKNNRAYEISKSEKQKYLDCKFWFETEKEAQIFTAYYFAPLLSDLGRAVGVLTGVYLTTKDFPQTLDILQLALGLYVVLPGYYSSFNLRNATEEQINEAQAYQETIELLIQAHKDGEINLQTDVIDELLIWASKQEYFDKKIIQSAHEKIKEVREKPVFIQSLPSNVENFYILKPLLQKMWYISYEDIEAILFPDQDYLPILKQAIVEEKLGSAWADIDGEQSNYYFSPQNLIFWLINHEKLPLWQVEEFPDLTVQVLEQSAVECSMEFISIASIIKKLRSIDRDDILRISNEDIISVYLRHPPDYSKIVKNTSQNKTDSNDVEITLYKGMGRLQKKNDDSQDKSDGNITLHDLFFNEKPSHDMAKYRSSIECKIRFVSTALAVKYGYQFIAKIPQNEISEWVNDNNLMIKLEDVLLILDRHRALIENLDEIKKIFCRNKEVEKTHKTESCFTLKIYQDQIAIYQGEAWLNKEKNIKRRKGWALIVYLLQNPDTLITYRDADRLFYSNTQIAYHDLSKSILDESLPINYAAKALANSANDEQDYDVQDEDLELKGDDTCTTERNYANYGLPLSDTKTRLDVEKELKKIDDSLEQLDSKDIKNTAKIANLKDRKMKCERYLQECFNNNTNRTPRTTGGDFKKIKDKIDISVERAFKQAPAFPMNLFEKSGSGWTYLPNPQYKLYVEEHP